MASKIARHGSFARFSRVPLSRPTECGKCGARTHTSLACPRDRKPLPQRREEPRRQSRTADPRRLAFLRSDVCGVSLVLGHAHDCSSVVDPEHERLGVGMSQLADDSRTWSCCRTHHIQLHALTGFFRGFDRERLRAFRDERISVSSIRYAAFMRGDNAFNL